MLFLKGQNAFFRTEVVVLMKRGKKNTSFLGKVLLPPFRKIIQIHVTYFKTDELFFFREYWYFF